MELDIKLWAKTNIHLASWRNRRTFLVKCRQHNTFPRHVEDSASRSTRHMDIPNAEEARRIDNFKLRLKHKLLNIEIRMAYRVVREKERLLDNLEKKICESLHRDVWIEFKLRNNRSYNRRFHKIKTDNCNKLNRLIQYNKPKIKVKDNWLRNFTDVQIPDEVKQLLSLGPKFSVPTSSKDLPIVHTLSEIENLLRGLDTQTKNIYAARVTNIITNYLRTSEEHNFFKNLYIKSKRFLAQHPELLVLRSDKGSVTVLMNKEQYDEMAMNILNDQVSYKKLNRDPTCTIQQKANKLISKLKNSQAIEASQARTYTIYNSISPKFYGLPKIHKNPVKLRPIISSIDAPTSGISQLVTDILTRSYSNENEYYIKDSFHLSTLMNNKQLPEGYVLVSLDVVSLFSNIPLDLTINCIKKKWEIIGPHCSMNMTSFLELVKFVFDNTYFSYNNQFYKQILGTPMGGQCSPIIALYVMDELLDICIPKLSFEVPFMKKYVDDLVCAVPQGKNEEILTIFNSYNEHIQFTIEEEDDNHSIPFLDTKMIRTESNVIKLDWYIKPTSSGRYMNYFSSVNSKMKTNLVLGLKNRIHKISHPDFYRRNQDRLLDILLDNSYPRHLLNRLIYSAISNPTESRGNDLAEVDSRSQDAEEQRSNSYGILPNIEGLTPKIIEALRPIQKKIAIKNLKIVGNLFSKTKDKTSLLDLSNIVYKINCGSCQATYIGQTSRCLKGRLTSHKSDCRTGKKTCALAEHVANTNHQPAYDSVQVLDKEVSSTRRCFKEMCRIAQEDNTINKKTDIDNLSHIYSYLILLDKDRSKGTLNNSHNNSNLSI